ncbi:Transmembrane protein 45B [Schistosoma haematobium]|uniref:Transmembrane protein 45B n=1 Tax=Schistosoma haematobium TaxID=6185 RepID=A0A095AN77_SCHHA|nr:Transmembrane protein 45B [Schistosoma haematobium]KAH9585847.1 Transmembrane protein 45B [Schistosoma haematobium]CAH8528351.1 unnamed protein product [Schistosoma haematobium]CAH8531583.1 unnamed protein product [Schistosoma haematobium]
MGTFGGHALPGSFFILYGLWSIWHILEKFYRRKSYELNKSNEPTSEYTCRISYPIERKQQTENDIKKCFSCCKKSFPLDSLAKLVLCIIGIIGEVITGFSNDWIFVHIGNAQHSTMFSLFGLSGAIELCIFYGIFKIPLQSEYLFHGIALWGELFLFLFHLHHRNPLDVYLHLLLTGMIILGILVSVVELLNPHEPIYGLIRSWTYLMQGTWFWQVGAILYPKTSWMPEWDQQAKQSIPAAANLFAYHMLGNSVAIILIAIPVMIRTKASLMSDETMRTRLSRREYRQQPQEHQQNFTIDNNSEEIELWNYNHSTTGINEVKQSDRTCV